MTNRRDILKYSLMTALLPSGLLAQTRNRKRGGKYLIVACDGGGMRGYLSSLILQRLNYDCGIFGPANRAIDLYAGTSTGGLIALGLAQGKSIDAIVDLYKGSGAQIFNPLGLRVGCAVGVASGAQVSGAGQQVELRLPPSAALWQVLFDDIGNPSLNSVLSNFIPGNPLLSSLGSKVMVATFQLSNPEANPASWNPLVIDNFDGSPGANTRLYDAALSTSAAPVYFPPYHHPKFGWCSDGGLFANNPSALALGLALQQGIPLSDIVLLSVGTGITNASVLPDSADRLCFGADRWFSLKGSGSTPPFPLLNAIMDGVSASTDQLCSQLLSGVRAARAYMRLNPVLPKSVALDDYSPETMTMFEQTAEAYFNSREWEQVQQWAGENFIH